MTGIEHEASLAIISDHPEEISRAVESLTHIGSYDLIACPMLALHDVYFDTPDSALERARVALRLREIDGRALVTLKGPSRPAPGGAIERAEFERPWSEESLSLLLRELAACGVGVPLGRLRWRGTGEPPRWSMEEAGLQVIQDRHARRAVRNVVRAEARPSAQAGEPDSVLAELAIDAVVYHLRGVDVRHYEVEIEAASERGTTAVRSIVVSLRDKYAPALRVWSKGKLATGRRIERLLREGALTQVLDRNGNLLASAYDWLAIDP